MSDYAFLCIPAFAALDRFYGSDWNPGVKIKGKPQGKKLAILLLSLGVGYLAGHWLGMALGGLWWLYRCIPVGDGVMTARTTSTKLLAFLWHAAPAPVAVFAAHQLGAEWDRAVFGFGLYAVAATGLAIWYGLQELEAERDGEAIGDQNVAVELIRGAVYGLAMMTTLAGAS